MKEKLGSSVDPTDASLETVMPGLLEKITILSKQQASTEEKVDRVATQLQGLCDRTDGFYDDFKDRCVALLERGIEAFKEGGQSGSSHQESPSPRPTNNNQPQAPQGKPASPSFTGVYLSTRFATLGYLWAEWHGEGTASGTIFPLPGGFEELERLYKATWRKHYTMAENRRFTRCRMVVHGIKAKSEATGIPVEAVLEELDKIYVTDLKRSIGALAKRLQDDGFVKKQKSRGRHVKSSD